MIGARSSASLTDLLGVRLLCFSDASFKHPSMVLCKSDASELSLVSSKRASSCRLSEETNSTGDEGRSTRAEGHQVRNELGNWYRRPSKRLDDILPCRRNSFI